ncbi:hypothetical protein SLS58_002629 [Diplodia intermedia]|uniref:Glycosyltransferase family 34 protein n=1 Tax=Diplodia intermedia TaxID=856260 RepID=A0ABR3TYY6_9PEZI
MRGVTGLGGRGLRVVILSLFVIVLFYTVGNFFERTVPYAIDLSETGFYPPNAVDSRPPDELVPPEVTTLSDEEHPASAKWHHEAMSKIKDKIGAWIPMDKVHGMYGAMRRPPWMGNGKSMDTDSPNYNHAPSPAKEERNAIVGKISILNHPQNDYIDRAVKTHAEHDRRHGYQHHTMREQIASNPAENFAAQMLSVLQAELTNPPSKRLEWLYYFPATSIILNPNVPLELFIPPTKNSTAFNETYLLYAAAAPEGPPSATSPPSPDLSNIAFAARVNQWSVDLLTTLVTRTKSAAPGGKKQQASSRADALAISSLLNLPSSSALSPHQHVLALPPNWLNAWPSPPSPSPSSIDDDDNNNDREETKGDGDSDSDIRPGSFTLILPLDLQNSSSSMTGGAGATPAPPPSSSSPSAFFFDGEDAASAAARDRFERWLARAEARSPRWETPLRETWYAAETGAFWDGSGGVVGAGAAAVLSSSSSSSSSFSTSSSSSSASLLSAPTGAAAFGSLSKWFRPPHKAPSGGGTVTAASELPSSSASHAAVAVAAAAVKPGGVLSGGGGEEGEGGEYGSGSSTTGGNRKTVPELKQEVLTLVRDMEASVHNWRQEVSEEVRRATESRCGRAREALAEVELDYGDGENEAGQDQAARAKLQAVIAGLRKVS